MSHRDVARIVGPTMLWARNRAGIGSGQLAAELGRGFTVDHVNAWEAGTSFPTIAQAELVAKRLRVPLAILFMTTPPPEKLPIPDRRTISEQTFSKPSVEFLSVLNDCALRQQWYREVMESEAADALPFVGRFGPDDPVKRVAEDIAKVLGIGHDFRSQTHSWNEFLTRFVQRAERAGILVMRSSVVRNASRRGLVVEEFRGFAISDPFAPLIFINSRDARAAQIFTLAHELVHIWIARSAISNPTPTLRSAQFNDPIERFCNEVAAELLVPEASFNQIWTGIASREANIRRVSSFHRVSNIVAIIRARELGRLSPEVADLMIQGEYARYKRESEDGSDQEGGPNFWVSFASRSSQKFTDAVVDAVRRKKILQLEASRLLGIKLGTLSTYISKFAAE